MEEILPLLQYQLQEASPPPKVQLGQQEDQQQQDAVALHHGLLTGIVMTATTIWNAHMMEETAVDPM